MEDGLQDNVWMDVNSGRSPIESVSGPYKKRELTNKLTLFESFQFSSSN